MSSGTHHWRPIQTSSVEDPAPPLHQYWHLVATEARTVGKWPARILLECFLVIIVINRHLPSTFVKWFYEMNLRNSSKDLSYEHTERQAEPQAARQASAVAAPMQVYGDAPKLTPHIFPVSGGGTSHMSHIQFNLTPRLTLGLFTPLGHNNWTITFPFYSHMLSFTWCRSHSSWYLKLGTLYIGQWSIFAYLR